MAPPAPAEGQDERAKRINYALLGYTGLFSADAEAALSEIRGQPPAVLAALRASYERLYGEYRLEDDLRNGLPAVQWKEAEGWLLPALPLDARLRLCVVTHGATGALLGFAIAGPVGSLVGWAVGRYVPTENERVMLATLAAWSQEVSPEERRAQARNPKVMQLLEQALSGDQLYAAKKLLRPDELEAIVRERIASAPGRVDDDEQAVYDALLDLPADRRRAFWDAERASGLFGFLDDAELKSVERLCTGTQAEVLRERMRLATAGAGTADPGVELAVGEVVKARQELDSLRAALAFDATLSAEQRAGHEARRGELEATLGELLAVRRDGGGEIAADTFLGQLYGDVGAAEAERFAAEMRVDPLEQIRQRILAATSPVSPFVDTDAVMAAIDDVAANPELRARVGDILADPVVAKALERLPVAAIHAAREHERGDAYAVAVRRIRQAMEAVNTDQAEVVRVLLGMSAADRRRLRTDDPQLVEALTTHTSVADSDLGAITQKLLAAPEGELPIADVIAWALGAPGDWAEPDALVPAFAAMSDADRRRYRLGYFLARGGSLPASDDDAAARVLFEGLMTLMEGQLSGDRLQEALDALLGTPTEAELASERGRLLAAGILEHRAIEKGRVRSAPDFTSWTSRTLVDAVSESGPLADAAQARLEAFYHQALADEQVSLEELAVSAALGREFAAAYSAHVATTDQIASIASTAAAVAIGIVVGVATAGVGTPAATGALAAAGLGPAVMFGGTAAAVAKVGTSEAVGGAHFDSFSEEGARAVAGAFVEGAANVLAAGLVARFSSLVGLGGHSLGERLAAATIEASETTLAQTGKSVSLAASRSALEGFLSGVVGETAIQALDEKTWRQSTWGVIEEFGFAILRGGGIGAVTGGVMGAVGEGLAGGVAAGRRLLRPGPLETKFRTLTPDELELMGAWLPEGTMARLPEMPAANVENLLALQTLLDSRLADPSVSAALGRMFKPDLPGYAVGPAKWLALLRKADEQGRLHDLMRIIADPEFRDPSLSATYTLLGRLIALPDQEFGFAVRHGPEAWLALSGKEQVKRGIWATLLGLPPAEQDARVAQLLEQELGPAAQAKALALPPPPRAQPLPKKLVAPRANDPAAATLTKKAERWISDNQDWYRTVLEFRRAAGASLNPEPTWAELHAGIVEDLTIVFYTFRRGQRGDFGGLSEGEQIKLLDAYDEFMRVRLGFAGIHWTGWANQYRGKLAEMISPDDAQIRLYAVPGQGTPSILDFRTTEAVTPAGQAGRIEYGERKSDLITAPAGSQKVYSLAKSRAKHYRMDADKDWPAIQANNGVHLIDWKQSPGNEQSREAMLEILFSDDPAVYATPSHTAAPGPPYAAVRFGDGKGWITREEWLLARAATGAAAP